MNIYLGVVLGGYPNDYEKFERNIKFVIKTDAPQITLGASKNDIKASVMCTRKDEKKKRYVINVKPGYLHPIHTTHKRNTKQTHLLL